MEVDCHLMKPGTVSFGSFCNCLVLFFVVLTSTLSQGETLGPSSKRTGLVISEVMYHPAPRSDGRNLEFVELYNSEPFPADINGFKLSGDVSFIFPTNTQIPALSFLVVAAEPGHITAVYGITNVTGGFGNRTNSIPNGGGTIILNNKSGAVLLELNYSDDHPWPVGADGSGPSMVLAIPSLGEADPQAWADSLTIGGSPGLPEPIAPDSLSNLLINEFLAHTDDPEQDFIELYNHGKIALDLSGCILTDNAQSNKFRIPDGTIIAAGRHKAFLQSELKFALSSEGETIFLKNSQATRVIDAVKFGPQENGVSSGRFPDGAKNFYRLERKTPGTANAPIFISQIVINELMYHPISGDDDFQFVELYNRGTDPVNLSGWKLKDGISFTFAPGTIVGSNSYLVVVRNLPRFANNYANVPPSKMVGDFNGRLSGSGERIALSMPDEILVTNSTGGIVTNKMDIEVDEVTYGTGGNWPELADGGGSSLELIDPRANHRLPSAWRASDERFRATETLVEYTGILDHGTGSPDSLQILLQGPGECTIDDVEVLDANGINRVSNSRFESDVSGWVAEGTHKHSSHGMDPGLFRGSFLHLRAVDRGDNTVNRVRTTLTSPLPPGTRATIRARVRWLKGHPEVLFRIRGNYLEAVGKMRLPLTPGTPSSITSVVNLGPAINEISHSPILPAANQAVVVSARIEDPDGLSNVRLQYRIDPSPNLQAVNMNDAGTAGDSVAGDGIFSGTIPGQPAGVLAAFHISATDASNSSGFSLYPNDAPARECLIRFGETKPAGSLGTYRIWMTQQTFNEWSSRSKLDNSPFDITFVYNDQRVIYNTKALYAGSPYISPGYNNPSGNLAGYTGDFPKDNQFLGTTDLVLDWPGRDSTALQEQASYWIAEDVGLPTSYRRFIRLHVNGVTETQRGSIYEDVQQPGREVIREWVPEDSDGQLFKIERWFEFSDGGGLMSDAMPTLESFKTLDLATQKQIFKTARYRWNWLPRAVRGSANDFTNLFHLVEVANAPAPEPYRSHIEGLVDVEQWMGIFAVEHIVNNFDSYGHNIAKNMYAYKPLNGKWKMFMFDLDWMMIPSRQLGYDTNSSLFDANDPRIRSMYNFPAFRRAYFRTVQKAVDGPMANMNAWLDKKRAGLLVSGVTRSAGQNLSTVDPVKIWVAGRRSYLMQQLATMAANFAITTSGGNDFSTTTNLFSLAGTAPIKMRGVRLNGIEYPVTWTGFTTWSLNLVLEPGRNNYVLEGSDETGAALPEFTDSINIHYNGAAGESALGRLVINEIMHSPQVPDAEFVELHNTSLTTPFDLSGWRLNGLDLDFSPGTILAPGGFLTVAKNRGAFASAYGNGIQLSGEFSGQLDGGGETLTLITSSDTNQPGVQVDIVSYEDDPPWPPGTKNTGSSLQLVDPFQDNFPVANWAVKTDESISNEPPQWQYVTQTGTASTSRLYVYMTSAGDVHIDDLKIVSGEVPEAGANMIINGDFETAFPGPWTVSGNLSASTISTVNRHSGSRSLRLISSQAGTTLGSSVWQDLTPLNPNGVYTLSFWFLPSANGSGLTIRLSGNGINTTTSIAPPSSPSALATPGAVNSTRRMLSSLSPVWLNELQPNNLDGPVDDAGESDPWVELYNAGTAPVTLNGWYLTDQFTNLSRWAFPPDTVLAPKEFKLVWLDGEPLETTSIQLHTSFRIPQTNGSLALVVPVNGELKVFDYLNYGAPFAGYSAGFYPDGHAGLRRLFARPTPGASNAISAPLLRVFINEWMASNTNTLRDPVDQHFEDWFELYNPNDASVALGGYALSDSLAPGGRWVIPNGTIIRGRGFLLVWADGETNQNRAGSPEIHADFRLSKDGESIHLFAPGGAVMDSVTFGVQKDDVSEGLYRDGTASIYTMKFPTPGAANVIEGGEPAEIRISASLNGQSQLVLTWNATPGTRFSVQSKTDLIWSEWTNITEITPATNVGYHTLLVIEQNQSYYRIQKINP